MKNVYIITRLSRPNFVKDLLENVSHFKKECEKCEINLIWGIGIDVNKLSPKEQKQVRDLLSPHAVIINSSTTCELYGSNIANSILNALDEANPEINQKDAYCYLLDDDNALHPEFAKWVSTVNGDYEFITCGQLRRGDEVMISHKIDALNCLGWIDSAQFLIRRDILKEIGNYADGYCIDGLTIQKYFAHQPNKDKMLNCYYVASFYNYFTEGVPCKDNLSF